METKIIIAFLLISIILISGCGQKGDNDKDDGINADNKYDSGKSSSLDKEAENFDQGSDDLNENEFDEDLGADVE